MRKGFVLAELLIVIAIIAILSIIAIPNFLEAQTRSNVSRAKSDLRTVATAMEAYALDNNKIYPSDTGNGSGGIWRPYANPFSSGQPSANFTIGYELTTPIAYVSSFSVVQDPFRYNYLVSHPALTGREGFGWMNVALRQQLSGSPQTWNLTRSRVGAWVLFSAGPDTYLNNLSGGGDYSNVSNIPRLRNYDPTNGIVSNGDIYRCEAHPDGAPEITTNL